MKEVVLFNTIEYVCERCATADDNDYHLGGSELYDRCDIDWTKVGKANPVMIHWRCGPRGICTDKFPPAVSKGFHYTMGACTCNERQLCVCIGFSCSKGVLKDGKC
jgi:hypothetical protein